MAIVPLEVCAGSVGDMAPISHRSFSMLGRSDDRIMRETSRTVCARARPVTPSLIAMASQGGLARRTLHEPAMAFLGCYSMPFDSSESPTDWDDRRVSHCTSLLRMVHGGRHHDDLGSVVSNPSRNRGFDLRGGYQSNTKFHGRGSAVRSPLSR